MAPFSQQEYVIFKNSYKDKKTKMLCIIRIKLYVIHYTY